MKTILILLSLACAAIGQQTVFEYSDGLTVKFNPNATRAGLNVGSHAGDPSSLNNGDLFYSSAANQLRARINGSTVALATGDFSALNASNLTTGTVPDARFPATLPVASGANLTALNASNLSSGTVPDARFPATLPALNGSALTALNASNLGSGTIPDARFPATLPALNGSALTDLNASNLSSGTVAAARLPAFTGDVTTSAGSTATTLATVNSNVGSFGNTIAIPVFTVNAKGLITSATTVSLTGVGTLTQGTWNATTIAGQYGGTGVNNSGKTLTLGGSYTINGTSGSTLDIGNGGTMGAAAFVGTSVGGNGLSDDGKAAVFSGSGNLTAMTLQAMDALSAPSLLLTGGGFTGGFSHGGGLTANRDWLLPDIDGTVAIVAAGALTVSEFRGNLQSGTIGGLGDTGSITLWSGAHAFESVISPNSGLTDTQDYILPANSGTLATESWATAAFQAVDADLTDLADGTLSGSKIGTGIDAGNITAGTLGSARGGAGTVNGVMKANGGGTVSAATAGTDYLSPGATQTVTATTLDAQAGTNVLKFIDEIHLTNPQQVDGTGAVFDTIATSATNGHAIFRGSTDKATNYVLYRFRVPFDLDTATDLSASFTFRLNAADTGKQAYEISMANVAASASADAPTFSNAIALNFAGDASGASGDTETVAYTTLTSWRSSLTAGSIIVVKLARDGDDGTNDTSTQSSSDVELSIKYGRAQ